MKNLWDPYHTLSKNSALKKLKNKNFIAVYITYKKGGKITKMLFGV